jgi:phosphatidylethanolamine/phosphatidyl-N-methylethanolamine N-methyltransferase
MQTANTVFWKSFLRSPLQTGSVIPSSRYLAQLMVADVDLEHASFIIELGPGTGPFTETILTRLSPKARFLAIERNPELVEFLNRNLSGVEVVCDTAEHIAHYVAEHGVGPDAVFCGLPLSWLPRPICAKVLDGVAEVLPPHGKFVMFQYIHSAMTPLGKEVHHELARRFHHIRTKRTMRNFPPAQVLICSK